MEICIHWGLCSDGPSALSPNNKVHLNISHLHLLGQRYIDKSREGVREIEGDGGDEKKDKKGTSRLAQL